ncbi:MAG: Asp-tRNA(Asn)/Glu-tRNA(Gln) amidotransferase subunit GatB [Clostridia bacterium]|nr:Asp-tRNA(Asn)/Glu-tRNA(Gln) amidotransferase subunit GatB [Clostridia bacterium]
MSEYNVVIGLEVHSELNTATKCFCRCKNEFGGEPNTHCCPVCTGMPGALPVLNREAVKKAITMGLAVGCEINNYSVFERKNYFYPDLAKAYQISQLEYPLCVGGHIDITIDGKPKRIRLNRIHLEEDAAKLIHSNQGTLVDYNRAGVPLIEIVSEPDMNSAEEAVAYLEKLKATLEYVGVSECKMQEGNLRFDVNISVNKPGEPLGTRTELKNLNSFRAVLRAIKYESNRQIDVLEDGGQIVQESRRWDDNLGKTFGMRSKEDSQDYRYFPDPDIIAIETTDEYIDEIRNSLPRLAHERCEDYIALGLSKQDAELLTSQKVFADYFEAVVTDYNEPKFVCNWITSEVFKRLNNEDDDICIPVCASNLAKLLKMYKEGEINQAGARQVMDELWLNDTDPASIVAAKGLKQMNDTGAMRAIVQQIIDENPKAVEDLQAGNTKLMSFFIGRAMKASAGKANPKIVTDLVIELTKK